MKTKNILVVEDDINTARAIAARLELVSFSVHATHSAWDAYRAARTKEFDLYILDVGLPDTNGIKLADQLLHIPGRESIPFVFLSGRKDFESRLSARKVGASGWVEKPFQGDDLVATVTHALGAAGTMDNRVTAQYSPLRNLLPDRGRPKSRKILVIEDDKNLARAMKLRLENLGFSVVVAYNGKEGLEAAIAHEPHLILSDIYMSGGLGLTLMEHLAQHDLGNIPVIYLTASQRANLKEHALRAGAMDLLHKPCAPADLLRSIRHALDITE